MKAMNEISGFSLLFCSSVGNLLALILIYSVPTRLLKEREMSEAGKKGMQGFHWGRRELGRDREVGREGGGKMQLLNVYG